MTKHVVVAIFDQQVAAYARPFFTPTPGAAIRAFQDNANDKDSPVYQHPEDYQLVELGVFDDETGRFTNIAEVKQLAIGKQMRTTSGE